MTACSCSAQLSQSAQSSQLARLSSSAEPSDSNRESASAERPAVGTWQLSNTDEVHADSTTVHLRVTRLGCSGGETGSVLQPELSYETDRIVIRTPVASLPSGNYTCQSNDSVPLTVQLSEAIGRRELVDMECADGPAISTSLCVTVDIISLIGTCFTLSRQTNRLPYTTGSRSMRNLRTLERGPSVESSIRSLSLLTGDAVVASGD